MATIAEVRARRAAELEEERKTKDAQEQARRDELLRWHRRDLEQALAGLGLDYTLVEGEAVALIEGYRVTWELSSIVYEWTVEKAGHRYSVGYVHGAQRLDFLLQAMADLDDLIADLADSADPVDEVDAVFGLPVPTLESRIAALETLVESLLQRVEDLEATVKIHDGVIDTLNGPWGSKIEQRISDVEGSQSHTPPMNDRRQFIISADEAERTLRLQNGSIF